SNATARSPRRRRRPWRRRSGRRSERTSAWPPRAWRGPTSSRANRPARSSWRWTSGAPWRPSTRGGAPPARRTSAARPSPPPTSSGGRRGHEPARMSARTERLAALRRSPSKAAWQAAHGVESATARRPGGTSHRADVLYTPEDLPHFDYDERLGYPGEPPYTRG